MYATVAEFREYMPQIKSEVTEAGNDAKITKVLNRATAIIDTYLGYAFGTAAEGEQTVYGDGTDYLTPPAYVAGSVELVEAPDGYTVPDYIEQDGVLVVVRGEALLKGSYYARAGLWGHALAYPYAGGWQEGVPYTITADFGYSAVPDDIKEACLEIAVRIWRGRDAGFSDVVGVEGGGAVGYNGQLPAMVKMILDKRLQRSAPGVH